MQVSQILHELLLPSTHKKRIHNLIRVVSSVLSLKKLQLSELGRHIKGVQERSGIRLLDKFLSNRYYQTQSIDLYRGICAKVLSNLPNPDILVDWSSIPNSNLHTQGGEHCVLRAALATPGRGITLYEEVHPKSKENNAKVHECFLKRLEHLLPKDCNPLIVTDSGFKNPWFKAVRCLGWHYLGRISGSRYIDEGNGFHPVSDLYSLATKKAGYLGHFSVAKTNAMRHHLVSYKGSPKGRHKLTKTKQIDRSKDAQKHSKSWKEPWILVTSLSEVQENPGHAVLKYKKRMVIEENFRDTKSNRYGLSFKSNKTIIPERLTVWLMLAALASLVAWLTGAAAEKLKLHYQFQANSYKHRRVLSFFYLGCQIIRKGDDVPLDWTLIQSEMNL